MRRLGGCVALAAGCAVVAISSYSSQGYGAGWTTVKAVSPAGSGDGGATAATETVLAAEPAGARDSSGDGGAVAATETMLVAEPAGASDSAAASAPAPAPAVEGVASSSQPAPTALGERPAVGGEKEAVSPQAAGPPSDGDGAAPAAAAPGAPVAAPGERQGGGEPPAAGEAEDTGPQAKGDAELDWDAQVFASNPPVFVHVPKNAGTAVQKVVKGELSKLGVSMYRKGKCRHHTPPTQHIRGGFVVVRPVLERIVSEFCWMRKREFFDVYRKEYNCPNVWPYTCDMFNAWLAAALDRAKKHPFFPDCHMVPQWCYASRVDYMVPMSDRLESSLRLLHPLLANVTLERLNFDTWGKTEGPCVRFNITPACISPSNLRAVREHYQDDFEHLEPHLPRSKVGRGAPPQPWAHEPGWVLGPAVKANYDCRVQDSHTLVSPSPCGAKERPPGVPEELGDTCVPSLGECAQLALKDPNCSSTINYYGNEDGPRGRFPGWCKCVLRGKDCWGSYQQHAIVTSFAKPVALAARCPRPMRPTDQV